MSEMSLVSSYVLRSKDIPLIDFSLYVSQELAFDTIVSNYTIKIEKIYSENKHLFPKNLSAEPSEIELLKWINRRKARKIVNL